MNDMRAILDEYEEEVSGEAILSGARVARVHVPTTWTPEYAGYRLVEGYEVLRRANVGRIYPSVRSGFWPTIYHDAADIQGWADEHRKQVENAMARRQARPDSTELQRMDEVMAWPLRHLSDNSLHADAVTLWAFTTAWEIDPAEILRWRKASAMPIAERIAKRENAERARLRQEAADRERDRVLRDFAKKKVLGIKDPLRRSEAVERIRNAARNRLEKELKKLRDVPVNPTLGMPGRILGLPTLDRMKADGLEALASRLNAARVPVR